MSTFYVLYKPTREVDLFYTSEGHYTTNILCSKHFGSADTARDWALSRLGLSAGLVCKVKMSCEVVND